MSWNGEDGVFVMVTVQAKSVRYMQDLRLVH